MQRVQSRKSDTNAAKFVAILFLLLAAARQAHTQTADQTSQSAQTEHRRKVVVSIPHRKLALIEDGKVSRVYPVAVGTNDTPSPAGAFAVKTRLTNPTYYHPGKVIPAGPANPLGTRWIGLSTKGYGIHGTNAEDSIGKAASHGCIRMHRKDLEELFASVQVGDQVEIRGDAGMELATIFGDLPAADTTSEATASASADAQQ